MFDTGTIRLPSITGAQGYYSCPSSITVAQDRIALFSHSSVGSHAKCCLPSYISRLKVKFANIHSMELKVVPFEFCESGECSRTSLVFFSLL